MRVTKVGVTRVCAICERTLLMGERAFRYAPEEGAELVDVCPLCQEIALEHGWLREGAPTTPTVAGDKRRRRRGLPEMLGLRRSQAADAVTPPEPILRRLSDDEVALLEAADLRSEGAELVDVCPLCQEIALEHGWLREGAPTTPTVAGDKRRRRRGLPEMLGLRRSQAADAVTPPEPILRRLSDDEVALLEAADL